jgi:50S ribosomal protein L16 3-hydroxylase
VAKELGTPMRGVSCNAYASPPGIGSRMHFDQQEVFLVQLQGHKQWRVAPCDEVRFPTEPYFGDGLRPELSLLRPSFPSRMPKSSTPVRLSPGSVLFMPRGTWHESRAVGASFALTFTFGSTSYADLVLTALRRQLVREAGWREPAAGLEGNGRQRAKAMKELQRRLAQLPRLTERVGRELFSSPRRQT